MTKHSDKDINYKTLRLTIGAIAFLMPFVTMAFFWWHSASGYPIPTSISVTYHLGAQDVFVGFLFIVGGFLVAYRGHSKVEARLAFLAGLCAFGISTFPTSVDLNWVNETNIRFDKDTCVVITTEKKCITASLFNSDSGTQQNNAEEVQLSPIIHYVSAIVLIGVLIIFTWLFRKRANEKLNKIKRYPLERVKRRLWIYNGCLVAMAIAMLLALVAVYRERFGGGLSIDDPTVYIVELICLLSFGVSWSVASKKLPLLKERSNIESQADSMVDDDHTQNDENDLDVGKEKDNK